MERIRYAGWDNCIRLTNGRIEAILTTDVGPRVLHLGFCGGANLFAQVPEDLGGSGETEWKMRGGHRFWLAPEEMPVTYEPDNAPVTAEPIAGGVRILQPAGPLSGCAKELEVTMDAEQDRLQVVHRIVNAGQASRCVSPWALSVMAPEGVAIIPLPRKVPHTECFLPNQQWSIWSYTDFTDGRWTLGRDFILFRQDRTCGPGKLGLVNKEGWAAYQLGTDLFVKRFGYDATASYPDGGVNFETFSAETFLEMESLGPLVDLAPGDRTTHAETWELYAGTAPVRSEQDAAILPPAQGRAL